MSPMAWMRRFMTLRGLFLVLGAVAVVLLIWFGGPLIAIAGWEPLASIAGRVIFLLMLAVIYMGIHLWRAKRQRRDNEKVVSEMMAGSDKDDLLKEEVDTQRERLRQALALVKKWRPGRFRSVYELPWYMIIGAPGSGKSTALLSSGLEFPLKDEMGIDSVKGVGGTRYCDWWFTNRAVIIDTAGRYTTQESTDKRDQRGWNSFLGLLKKYRSRQPINGVILSVSVTDLLEQTPTEQMLHARALKQRVQELKNRLGVVFPVYVVLTKFDLLDGFADTFGMLSEQERDEVFGMTFELQSVCDPKTLPDSFDAEFDGLLERLSHFLLHRMQQERTPAARRRIYQFPKQTALLRAPLWNLVKEVFFPSAYEDVPILRGIYLVSSEQGGKTYDKVSHLVDDHFRLKVPKVAATVPTPVRDGFFLRQLFENIIFSEHGLASADGRKEKHFAWARRAALAGMVALTCALGVGWYLSYQWNSDLVASYDTGIDKLKTNLAQPHQDWVQLDDLLSEAARFPGVLGTPLPEGGPRQMGLFQGNALRQAAEGSYGRLLQHQFGRGLQETLESEISSNLSNLEYLYETLKVYLMLNETQRLDEDQVAAWFEFTLRRQLPGDLNADVRKSLLTHLAHYLELNHGMPVKAELIARARAELTALPLAERAYQRIRLDGSASRLPEFRLPMVLGSVAEQVFERRSGTSLREGIPGLYTVNGYKGIFEPEKDKIVGRLLEDSWVYGEEAQDFGNLDEKRIKASVEDRYFRDYIHHWETFLSDLRVKPFSSPSEGMRVASLIAGPEAPMSRLLAAVKYNTELTVEENNDASQALDSASDTATSRLAQRSRGVSELMRMMPEGSEENEPETLVDKAFKSINQVDEATLQSLQANAKVMARYFEEQSMGRNAALASVTRPQFDDAVRGFYSSFSDSDSEVLKQMLGSVVRDSRRMVKTSATRKVNDIWRSNVYADYQQAIAGKYPFERTADSDVALMDFANFFGYGGTLDQFFNENLKDHVNTSRSPWRLTGDVGIKQGSLRLFEEARRIREAFFEPGSRTPRLAFTLKPTYLDSRVTQFVLEIDGQAMTYRHGPPRAISFRWPDPAGAKQTRVALTPLGGSASVLEKTYQGTWSIFRMLQTSGGMIDDGRRQIMDVLLGDFLAKVEITANSVKHPFATGTLEGFRLPPRL